MTLAESQQRFLDGLLSTAASSPGMEVYRRTLRANRHDALRASHPVVARLVGDAFFAEAAARFADDAPSRSGDLHEYGVGFAAFLGTYPHAASLPYLADVARLEWAVHRCTFAADPLPFELAALAAVPDAARGQVRFVPQAGTELLVSEHPVVSIWEANQPAGDGELAGPWRPETALAFRCGLRVVVRRVGPEAGMLSRLLGGEALETACVAPSDAASLPGWVEAGLFRGIAT
jgi:hypothetical protein